jgi:hypothetical protein
MDKVGVILMLFTGVAFIAKLLEGMQFATPVTARNFSGSRTQKLQSLEVLFDGKFSDPPGRPIPVADLPKGCEDFRLEPGSLSPLDPRVRGVVIGEIHGKSQTEKCLLAIEKQKKVKTGDRKVYFVEGIPEGIVVRCQEAPGGYQYTRNRRCIGWDRPENYKVLLEVLADKEFRETIKTLKRWELRDPLLFRLEFLTREEAEKWIHEYLNELILFKHPFRFWAYCKMPRCFKDFSPDLRVFCGLFERLEKFLWTIHDLGLSKALETPQQLYPSGMNLHFYSCAA